MPLAWERLPGTDPPTRATLPPLPGGPGVDAFLGVVIFIVAFPGLGRGLDVFRGLLPTPRILFSRLLLGEFVAVLAFLGLLPAFFRAISRCGNSSRLFGLRMTSSASATRLVAEAGDLDWANRSASELAACSSSASGGAGLELVMVTFCRMGERVSVPPFATESSSVAECFVGGAVTEGVAGLASACGWPAAGRGREGALCLELAL